jgi:hypothetical protein
VDANEYAAKFWLDLAEADENSARSQQSVSGIIGPSDMVCRERARHIVIGTPMTDRKSNSAAIIGTFIHQGLERGRGSRNPHLLHEIDIEIELPNGATMVGHADEIDPEENSVTDFKTVGDLDYRRRIGAELSHLRQVHLYALGLVQAEILKPNPIVRICYIDRSGKHNEPYVYQQRFDEEIINGVDEWISDVIYAVQHNEEASKDWPREMCRSFCPYYSSCRTDELEGEALLGEVAQAARVYMESHKLEKEHSAIKDQAKVHLANANGFTEDGIAVRWITVNNEKGSYDRIDVRKLPGWDK